MSKPRYYACEICGHNHPWEWDGDCREECFTDEQLDAKHGEGGYIITGEYACVYGRTYRRGRLL